MEVLIGGVRYVPVTGRVVMDLETAHRLSVEVQLRNGTAEEFEHRLLNYAKACCAWQKEQDALICDYESEEMGDPAYMAALKIRGQ